MKNVLIATGPGFQDEEVIYPWYRFREEFKTDVVTSTDALCFGKYGCKIKPTIKMSELDGKKYDCIFVPGGHEGPDRVRQCKEILKCISFNYENGCLISTICHGPWVLISAGITRGKKITGYIAIKDDVNNSGATYIESDLVEDQGIISSPHYDQNPILIKRTCEIINNS